MCAHRMKIHNGYSLYLGHVQTNVRHGNSTEACPNSRYLITNKCAMAYLWNIGCTLCPLEVKIHHGYSQYLGHHSPSCSCMKSTIIRIAMGIWMPNEPTLTPSRRQCPYGHFENHLRSYSTKSLVLKLRAHMRALTASKDQYKLKSSQDVCVNLNIFVTVVPWKCMVFKNISTRIKNQIHT
jgi:hypothetical protein